MILTSLELLEFFDKQTAKMRSIMEAKNADYTGATADPFANFSRVESLGICSTEQGFLTRMTDKLCRIASFVKKGELKVKDESVHDTLIDLANYAILMAAHLSTPKVKTETLNVENMDTLMDAIELIKYYATCKTDYLPACNFLRNQGIEVVR